MDRKKTGIATLAALVAMALVFALVPQGSAGHAQAPDDDYEGNRSCASFNASWLELKIPAEGDDPPVSGTYESDDGLLNVTIAVENKNTLDFIVNDGAVVAVLLKASPGGNVYEYDPPEDEGDRGLTTPLNKNDKHHDISHIRFCYIEVEDEPELLCPTNLRAVVDGEDIVVGFDPAEGSDGTNIYRSAGGADAELVAELGPDATRYRDTDVEVNVTYTYEARAVYGELESEPCPTVEQRIEPEEPEPEPPEPEPEPPEPEPEPEPECPAVDLQATANADSSITVNVATNASFELMRSEGDQDAVSLGTFEGDTQVVDTDTVVGTTYTYTVVVDGQDCGSIQVTAIPVFPTVAAMGLALTASLLGYAGLRRRW